MTDLHKITLLVVGMLITNIAYANYSTFLYSPHSSPTSKSIVNCPSDSLAVSVQSSVLCSKSPIDFQTNMATASLSWEYGDGTINNGLAGGQATHVYLNAGEYTVKVTATYGDNCTETKSIPVTILSDEVDFEYQVVNQTVTFTAIPSPYSSITRYLWTLGDGATASGLTSNMIYTYRNQGEYTVTLIGEGDCPSIPITKTIMVGTPLSPEDTPGACTDGIDNDGDGLMDCDDSECECICTSGNFGCCDDIAAEVNVQNASPGGSDGSFEIIPSGGSGKTIHYQVIWGNISTDSLFKANQLPAGEYQVELRDTAYGCSLPLFIEIENDACLSNAISSEININNSSICDAENGKATIQSSGGLAPYDYEWSNGSFGATATNLEKGPQSITVTDMAGCISIETFDMPSTSDAVTATFSYEITADSVLFNDASLGPITSRQWTFNTPNLILDNRTPLPPSGSYEICLIVENDCEGTDTQCQTVAVAPACAGEALQINLLDDLRQYCTREPIELSTNVIAQKYTWYFGERNDFTGEETMAEGANLQNTTQVYFKYGTPTVKLIVDYGNDCKDSTSIELDIRTSEADFTYSLNENTARFTADTTDAISSYNWTVIGPTTSFNGVGRVVEYELTETGEYVVGLFTTGDCNGIIKQKIININNLILPENSEALCSDGIDNDGDGLLDCEDTDCPCPVCPTDLVFNSQIEVDNFAISYPECTSISGDVTIQSIHDNINNLTTLQQLISIGGDLVIIENPSLSSLNGLQQLGEIGGDLDIDQNSLLSDFSYLNRLESIGGSLAIGELTGLTSLFGADAALYSIENGFLLYGNTQLTNLSSLEDVVFLGGTLEIANQTTLQSVSGLENITTIGGSIFINNNENLNSLSALQNLTNIQGEIFITENGSLQSLTGLDNIVATSISKVTIQSSSVLSTCNVNSICTFINNGGTTKISGNTTGCASVSEIEAVCFPTTPANGLFVDYPWILTLIDTVNCEGVNIQEYHSRGNQVFIYIEEPRGTMLYTTEGQVWCASTETFSCLSFYPAVENLRTWDCVTTPVVDADGDGISADTDPDDNDPCVPDASVAACTTDTSIPSFYVDYPWLTTIVDPANCSGEEITVYTSSGYTYLLIESESSSIIYNHQGTLYCQNGNGLNCFDYYGIDEVLDEWTCGSIVTPIVDADMDGTPSELDPDDNDPCVPDNTVDNCDNIIGENTPPDFIDDYPWLVNFIDIYTCTVTKVTLYKSGSFDYLYLEQASGNVLYNGSGLQYCSDGIGLNCLDFYTVDEVISTWTCGGDTPPTEIDEDEDGTPANLDPDDTDPCVPNKAVSTCNDNPVEERPTVFVDYPWLTNLIDPADCNQDSITIYESSGYIYLLVERENSTVLYNADGLQYCVSKTNFNCQEFYAVDQIINTWSCKNTPITPTPIDADNDGVYAEDDPDDNDPCNPDSTGSGCGTPPATTLFDDFSWLNDLIDSDNCDGDSILHYTSSGYDYLLVTSNNGSVLYNGNGVQYCINSANYNCTDFYTIDEVVETWSCGSTAGPTIIDADNDGVYAEEDPDDNDPCNPDNTRPGCGNPPTTPTLFEDFHWLTDLVNPNNCEGDSIIHYKSSGYDYLLVITSTSSIVYNGTGVLYCTNTTTYNCTDFYAMDEVISTWSCGTITPPVTTGDCGKFTGNIRLVNCSDGTPFFFIEMPDGTIYDPYFEDGLTFDYYDGQTVNFDSYGADFFSPCNFVQGTIILTCIEESNDCFCPDTNLPVCGEDGNTYANACEAECAGVPVLSETECNSSVPNFFPDYPWLADIVDVDNCTTEKITVFRTGAYNYIWIETPAGKTMYFEDGTLYCQETPDFDCLAYYQLDSEQYAWSCESTLEEDAATSRVSHTTPIAKVFPNTSYSTHLQLYPNPTQGRFFVAVNNNTEEEQILRIMDLQGRVVQQLKLNQSSTDPIALDLAEKKGIYMVQLISESSVQSKRVIVE